MKYINTMAFLNTALIQIKHNRREPITKSMLKTLLAVLGKMQSGTSDTRFVQTLSDTIDAVQDILSTDGLTLVPDSIKQQLIQNLLTMKTRTAELAYSYYLFCDFEPTEEIIPIMREIVYLA
jgi:hypothetical protein